MKLTTSAANFLPSRLNLAALRKAAAKCQGCELFRNATQTVFGRGPRHAKLLIVGEQQGDQEDRAGEPFVGPAGRLLDEILEEAKIDSEDVYVTNAVKHFKWKPRGKRRLHAKPSSREISACHPWLGAEIQVVNPKLIFCLGATAAQSILGNSFRVTRDHGHFKTSSEGLQVLATFHPSAVLRALENEREKLRAQILADARIAAHYIAAQR